MCEQRLQEDRYSSKISAWFRKKNLCRWPLTSIKVTIMRSHLQKDTTKNDLSQSKCFLFYSALMNPKKVKRLSDWAESLRLQDTEKKTEAFSRRSSNSSVSCTSGAKLHVFYQGLHLTCELSGNHDQRLSTRPSALSGWKDKPHDHRTPTWPLDPSVLFSKLSRLSFHYDDAVLD